MNNLTYHNVTPQVQHWVRVCDIQTKRLVWSSVDNSYVGDARQVSKFSRYDALRKGI